MAINQSTSGGNTTITLTYTAENQKVLDTLTDASTYLFNRGRSYGVELDEGETVADLTNAQRGQIIDGHVKQTILDLAQAQHVEEAKTTAQETALSEVETKYI